MAQFDVIDAKTKKPCGDKIEVPQDLLSVKPEVGLLHEVVVAYRSNERRGTASTLTRSEVSGGGKKPWKQKGTGRARSGSNRSPLWRKGGVTFGPKPRSNNMDLGTKKKGLALAEAIVSRFPEHVQFIKEDSICEIVKTQELVASLGAADKKQSILLVVSAGGLKVWRSARNLPNVNMSRVDDCNAYDVLKSTRLVFTDKAWAKYMEKRYHGV